MGLSWTILDYLGLSWTTSYNLRLYGTFSDYLGLSQTISNYLRLSQTISDYLGLCGTVWDYLGLSRTISDYLVRLGLSTSLNWLDSVRKNFYRTRFQVLDPNQEPYYPIWSCSWKSWTIFNTKICLKLLFRQNSLIVTKKMSHLKNTWISRLFIGDFISPALISNIKFFKLCIKV